MFVRARVVVAVLSLGPVLAGCGSGSTPASSPGPAPPGSRGGPVLVSEGLSFDRDHLEIAAGTTVTIEFDNRDTGVPHNLRVKGRSVDVSTKVEKGDVVQYLDVRIDRPGTFTFVCDVHPVQMKGELTVR